MKKRILITILAMLVLAFGVVGCGNDDKGDAKGASSEELKPSEILVEAMLNGFKSRNVNAEVSIKAKINEEKAVAKKLFEGMTNDQAAMAKFVNSLLEKTELRYGANIITKDNTDDLFKLDLGIGLYYDKKDLINGTMYMKPWEVGFAVPQLTSKALAFDFGKVLGQEESIKKLEGIKIADYINLLTKKDKYYDDLKANFDNYKKVMVDYYEGKVEKLKEDTITVNVYGKEQKVDVTKYKMNLDLKNASDVNVKLAEVAKKDKALKAFILARLDDLEKLMLENKDYEKFDVAESEFKDNIKEAKESIEKDWDEFLTGMIKAFKEQNIANKFVEGKEDLDFEAEYICSVDKDGRLRQQECNLKMDVVDLYMTITMNAFGDDVKVDLQEDSDKIDLAQIETNTDLQTELTNDVISNLGKVLSSEAVEEILKDIKENSKMLPKDESDSIVEFIDTQFNQVKMMLPFILSQYKLGR
ncbi:hypothetical protein PV797_07265 [Clostridiaceae bacterium M8S5]|nr:hypothetical protein PV797_07265 [Clostridiaceae bacterium M8S5]